MRPRAPRQIVRKFVYVYTAVCPSLGRITSLILPHSNTEMMNIFLDHVSKDFSDYFVIMILDQAGWHRSTDLKIPENIRLMHLPPYSPELNPVEHIWDYIRENDLFNVAFSSMDQLEDTLCDALISLEEQPELVRSMTNFPYLRVTEN